MTLSLTGFLPTPSCCHSFGKVSLSLFKNNNRIKPVEQFWKPLKTMIVGLQYWLCSESVLVTSLAVLSRGSSRLTVHHRGEGIAGGSHVVCAARKQGAERKWGVLPNLTAFLWWLTSFRKPPPPQASPSSAPAGDQVSSTWAYRGHLSFRRLTEAETYMTHIILGSLLYPTSFSDPFSLSPSCFFWFSVRFQSPLKEVKAMTNKEDNGCGKANLVSWSTNPESEKDSAHAPSLSPWPVTQTLGCMMDRALHTCRRQGSGKRRHSINITK